MMINETNMDQLQTIIGFQCLFNIWLNVWQANHVALLASYIQKNHNLLIYLPKILKWLFLVDFWFKMITLTYYEFILNKTIQNNKLHCENMKILKCINWKLVENLMKMHICIIAFIFKKIVAFALLECLFIVLVGLLTIKRSMIVFYAQKLSTFMDDESLYQRLYQLLQQCDDIK